MFFGRASEDPTFIPHSKIHSAVLDLIDEAERELVLVTPYFKPWNHLQTSIRGRLRARIPVNLVIRADEVAKATSFLQVFAAEGAQVLSLERLHAKLYMSEKRAIITSMNLLETSALNSWECALQIVASDSPALYGQFVEQVKMIRMNAQHVSLSGGSVTKTGPQPQLPPPQAAQVDFIQHFGIRRTELKPEMVEARRSHPRAYETWTAEEEAVVVELAKRRVDSEDIGRLLGRQPSAIERKLQEIY